MVKRYCETTEEGKRPIGGYGASAAAWVAVGRLRIHLPHQPERIGPFRHAPPGDLVTGRISLQAGLPHAIKEMRHGSFCVGNVLLDPCD
jgi:hypothetical protein